MCFFIAKISKIKKNILPSIPLEPGAGFRIRIRVTGSASGIFRRWDPDPHPDSFEKYRIRNTVGTYEVLIRNTKL